MGRGPRALRPLQGPVLVGARSRHPSGRRVHAARPGKALEEGPRRNPRDDRAARLRLASAGCTCSRSVAASWTRRCFCCRRSSTWPGTTSACSARSRRCARSSTRATASSTATGATTAWRATRARSCPVRSGWPSAWPAAGILGDARAVFDQAVARANDLGLFSEEIDPRDGRAARQLPAGPDPPRPHRRCGGSRRRPGRSVSNRTAPVSRRRHMGSGKA